MPTTALPAQTLHAPTHWSAVECIADLHLQASEPATLAAWQRYLKSSPAKKKKKIIAPAARILLKY